MKSTIPPIQPSYKAEKVYTDTGFTAEILLPWSTYTAPEVLDC